LPLSQLNMTVFLILSTASHLFGLASAVHALHQVRTSQGTVGWIVGLIALPMIALPLYWLGGRTRFYSYREDYQQTLEAMESLHPTEHLPETSPAGNHPIDALVPSIAAPGYLAGNDIKILKNAVETFPAILKAIAEAKHYVLVEYYILADDEVGNRLLDALVEAVTDGVQVIVLVDGIGSYSLGDSFIQRAEDAGIEFHRFAPHKGLFARFELNFRNHRKIVVVDGEVAFTGGLNMGDEYVDGGENHKNWRDTHLALRGPCVLSLQTIFAKDYHWATRSNPPKLRWPAPSDPGRLDSCIVPTGPGDPHESGAALILTLLTAARERVWISTPFFVPELGIEDALVAAILRGVDVRVLIPDRSASRIADLARETSIDRLNQAGARFFVYQEGFVHQKVVLVDDLHAAIGSLNFDNRSVYLNFEVTALVRDGSFNSEVASMLEDDFKHSKLIKLEIGKSIWRQFLVRIARLFSPVL